MKVDKKENCQYFLELHDSKGNTIGTWCGCGEIAGDACIFNKCNSMRALDK